jgi:glycoside/pentoside/hexuronide:cation symporter, GPH family
MAQHSPAQYGERLSVTEKVGYSLGDLAAGFVFQTMVMLQLSFYTDTFGITAAAAGTLLAAVRVFDAVFDPLMGVVADRTRTRWGKFRPWVLWTAVPFGVMAVVAFTTPDLSPSGKLAWAYVTYILLMMVYSANNLPYSALSGVMTGDVGERTSLSQYRFVAAMLGQLVIQGLALPMVHALGGGNDARGYQLTFVILGSLAVVLFFITFATTRERIEPMAEHSSIGQDFRDLGSNGPWKAMFVLTVVLFITLALRGGAVVYYFKYYLNREDLFGPFNVVGTLSTIVGVILSKPLSLKYGKRNLFIAGLVATAVLSAAFVVYAPTAIPLIIATEGVRQFAYGFTIPLLWAMMADVADFSEWRTGRRATGVVFSAIVFGLKAGLGFGGAIGGYLLAMYGYVPNVAQNAAALDGIRYSVSVFPAVLFALCAGCLLFYSIDRTMERRVSEELAARRRGARSPLDVDLPVPSPAAAPAAAP